MIAQAILLKHTQDQSEIDISPLHGKEHCTKDVRHFPAMLNAYNSDSLAMNVNDARSSAMDRHHASVAATFRSNVSMLPTAVRTHSRTR